MLGGDGSTCGGSGAIWSLSRDPHGASGSVLAEALRAHVQRLERLVVRDLPILTRATAQLGSETWNIVRIAGPAASTLDGLSYSASFLLAMASLLVGRPVPGDLAASIAVSARGELAPVDGLKSKLSALARHALGVRRFLVHESQREDVATIAAPLGLEVTSCRRLADLFNEAFPDAADYGSTWAARSESESLQTAERLFTLCLHDREPLLAWSCVARSARSLREDLERRGAGAPSPRMKRALEQLTFAEAFSARHDSNANDLAWPSPHQLGQMPRVVRFTFLAHLVQQKTDSGADDLEQRLAETQALVPPPLERCTGALKLRGAIGRGLARLGRSLEAAIQLEEVVGEWRESLLPAECSFALCEWLRVAGQERGFADHLTRAEAAFLAVRDDLTAQGLAFSNLAFGRALVQAGRAAEAGDFLGESRGPEREHLEASRLRWLARQRRDVGDGEGARAAFCELERLAAQDTASARANSLPQWLLARLDAGIEPPDALVSELRSVAPHEVRWLPTAADVRDRFPY
jgi:hypothetical protein